MSLSFILIFLGGEERLDGGIMGRFRESSGKQMETSLLISDPGGITLGGNFLVFIFLHATSSIIQDKTVDGTGKCRTHLGGKAIKGLMGLKNQWKIE